MGDFKPNHCPSVKVLHTSILTTKLQYGDNMLKNRLQRLENIGVVQSKSVKVTVGIIPAQVPGTTAAATSTRGPASVSATRACSET